MALRYVGTIDDLTPERLRQLRTRVKRNRDVWDAKTERYAEPESGMLVTQTSSYSMDPFGGVSTLVNWRTGTAFVLGALAAALIAAIVWWWNQRSEKGGKKKGKKRRQIEASA